MARPRPVQRGSILHDIDQRSENARQNSRGNYAFSRHSLGPAPPLTNMPVEIAANQVWAGSVNAVYFKRLSVPRDNFNMLVFQASTGTVAGRVGVGIYRIETVSGTGLFSGLVVPRLVRVWSHSAIPSAASSTYTVAIKPPAGFTTSGIVDSRADVALLPTEDYMSAVAVSVATGNYQGAIGTQQIVSTPMTAGWTDLPQTVDFKALAFDPFVPQFVLVACKDSTVFALW